MLARATARVLGLPFSRWTEPRLADYLAERTSVRLSRESVHRLLRARGAYLRWPCSTLGNEIGYGSMMVVLAIVFAR